MISIIGKLIEFIWQAVPLIILGTIVYQIKLAKKIPPKQTESDNTKALLSKLEHAINVTLDQKAERMEEQKDSLDELSEYSFEEATEFEGFQSEYSLVEDYVEENIVEEPLDVEERVPVYNVHPSTQVSNSMRMKRPSTSSRIRQAFILQEILGKPKSMK